MICLIHCLALYVQDFVNLRAFNTIIYVLHTLTARNGIGSMLATQHNRTLRSIRGLSMPTYGAL